MNIQFTLGFQCADALLPIIVRIDGPTTERDSRLLHILKNYARSITSYEIMKAYSVNGNLELGGY